MKKEKVIKFNESIMKEYEFSLEQLWDRYVQYGKENVNNLMRGMHIEFHNKDIGFYEGEIIGILPFYSYKDKVKKLLLDTDKYGTLEVDDDYSITIKDPRLL
jgi:hypothetical protein